MGKLNKIQIIAIGLTVTIIVGGGMFWFLVKPAREELQQVSARLAERQAVADRLPQAQADLEKAKLENIQAKINYRRYEDQKMPYISFADRTQGMIAYWKERAEVLGPMIRTWPRKFGVELMNDIKIDAASTDPNSYSDGLMTLTISGMRVRGSYWAILKHLEGWNKFGRLVQVSPISISGVSPNLEAQYGLRVHMFPRGRFGQNVALATPSAQDASGAGGVPSPPPPPPPPPSQGSPDGGE